ncbi:hypothetical protein [Aeromonas sp. MdU4]|uniref:hypothetical protein n=1 Tax=Aeromonas sp. MdU4 TaxID=3342819 RepID=UPI0035BA97F7
MRNANRREIICNLCHEVVSKSRLFMHLVKRHNWDIVPKVTESTSGIQKLDLTDGAHVTSLVEKNRNTPVVKKPKVELVTMRGMRETGLAKCQQCKVNHMEHWVYRFSDGSTKKLCRFCKGRLLDKVKSRKSDAMDYRVPGSAMSGKNNR